MPSALALWCRTDSHLGPIRRREDALVPRLQYTEPAYQNHSLKMIRLNKKYYSTMKREFATQWHGNWGLRANGRLSRRRGESHQRQGLVILIKNRDTLQDALHPTTPDFVAVNTHQT